MSTCPSSSSSPIFVCRHLNHPNPVTSSRTRLETFRRGRSTSGWEGPPFALSMVAFCRLLPHLPASRILLGRWRNAYRNVATAWVQDVISARQLVDHRAKASLGWSGPHKGGRCPKTSIVLPELAQEHLLVCGKSAFAPPGQDSRVMPLGSCSLWYLFTLSRTLLRTLRVHPGRGYGGC